MVSSNKAKDAHATKKHKKPIKHLSTIEVSFTAENAVRLNDTSGFTLGSVN